MHTEDVGCFYVWLESQEFFQSSGAFNHNSPFLRGCAFEIQLNTAGALVSDGQQQSSDLGGRPRSHSGLQLVVSGLQAIDLKVPSAPAETFRRVREEGGLDTLTVTSERGTAPDLSRTRPLSVRSPTARVT